MLCVKVILRQAAPAFDRVYTYIVPARLAAEAVPGRRVLFPFGKGDRLEEGIVFAKAEPEGDEEKLKELFACLDPWPLLLPVQLKLLAQMKQRYACTYGAALSVMLPGGVRLQLAEAVALTVSGQTELPEEFRAHWTGAEGEAIPLADLQRAGFGRLEIRRWEEAGLLERRHLVDQKVKQKTAEYCSLTDPDAAALLLDEQALGSIQQEEAVRFLLLEGEAQVQDLLQACDIKRGTLRTLQSKELLTFSRKAVLPEQEDKDPFASSLLPAAGHQVREDELTDGQNKALDEISQALQGDWKPGEVPPEFLLFGITGSGKTEVYMRAAQEARNRGKTVLLLVPEIALTPQMVGQFEQRFPGDVAVMHSRLTPRQRYDCWESIRLGRQPIVIGARSAVFMPLADLGLIMIDEEQEESYQSDMSPRYQAATIARLRSRNEGAVLVLGSATPSLESYQRTEEGKSRMLSLQERPGTASLPETHIVDLRRDWNSDTDGLLSLELIQAMQEALARDEQVLLFLNRRGFASTCLCKDCGEAVQCPSCAIGMTYHLQRNQLVCHYCGLTQNVPEHCPSCGDEHVILYGAGTQKLESICERLFPAVTIVRMDQDMTSGAYGHAKLLKRFREAGAAILIGTQMIAKGHDFPRLTVSAVLSADQMLGRNDIRAAEKAFQLMTQTAGRAGRQELAGKVYIQAFNVDHYALQSAAAQDYPAFVEQELNFRRVLRYPPFSVMATIGISSEREEDCRQIAAHLYQKLSSMTGLPEWQGVEVLQPARSALYKLQGRWRWQMLLRAGKDGGVRKLSTLWQSVSLLRVPQGLRLSFILDPA